jgi:penicillin-binding protein 1C
MHEVSGVSGAAPIWRALVQQLHAGRPSKPPAMPPGVIALAVVFDGGREPARPEVFLAGTEQARQRASAEVAGAQAYGITSPRDGSMFALDPDIPPAAQRIRFEGEHGVWVLDGKRLGQGTHLSWPPWPGRHELALLGPDGRPLQTLHFEVRGAGLKLASATTRAAPGAGSRPR